MSGKNISDIVKNILLILKNSLGQMRFICAKYLKDLVLVKNIRQTAPCPSCNMGLYYKQVNYFA